MMDKVQKPSNADCYTPLSGPCKIYIYGTALFRSHSRRTDISGDLNLTGIKINLSNTPFIDLNEVVLKIINS
jgi:hypothetical protein